MIQLILQVEKQISGRTEISFNRGSMDDDSSRTSRGRIVGIISFIASCIGIFVFLTGWPNIWQIPGLSQPIKKPEQTRSLSGPTPGTGPTPISTQYLTPQQFIEEYYGAINNRDYNRAWSMLSDSFKQKYHCCASNGDYQFSPYATWWDSIEEIEILRIERKSLNPGSATVTVTLRYHFVDGRTVDDEHTLRLVADGASWLIDEQ